MRFLITFILDPLISTDQHGPAYCDNTPESLSQIESLKVRPIKTSKCILKCSVHSFFFTNCSILIAQY